MHNQNNNIKKGPNKSAIKNKLSIRNNRTVKWKDRTSKKFIEVLYSITGS